MEDVNNIVSVIEIEGKTIRVSDFPNLLTQQISLIKDNSEKIVEAKDKAKKAKTAAEKAKSEKVKWYNKTASIEALQKALEPMIDALEGQTDIADSLAKSIQAILDASKFLFVLGVSNMAANRMVIRELELKLNNASKEQLSALAQQELKNVLYQLKAQENTFARLDAVETKVKSLIEVNKTLETRIEAQEDNNTRLDSIERNNKALEESTNSIRNQIQSVSSCLEQHNNNVKKVIKGTLISKIFSLIAIIASIVSVLFVFLR